MAMLGFKDEFEEMVESGKKTQTIRARRKRRVRVGERLTLACGVRTKKYRRLRADKEDVCTETFEVQMLKVNGAHQWYIRGEAVSYADERMKEIAERDGFTCVADMSKWFDRHNLKRGKRLFEGDVIRWK